MQKMTVLFADKGKILTDGTAYGTNFYVNEGESTEHIKEMTLDELEALNNSQATEADYLAALERLGVSK